MALAKAGTTRSVIILIGSLLFSVIVLIIDHFVGPLIRLPVLYVIPVLATSWMTGFTASELIAIGFPLARLFVMIGTGETNSVLDSSINTAIIILTLSMLAFLASLIKKQQERIKVLQGFLPTCAFCKRIRKDDGTWEQMEYYIKQHSEAEFSHGVCPECSEKHYGIKLEKAAPGKI